MSETDLDVIDGEIWKAAEALSIASSEYVSDMETLISIIKNKNMDYLLPVSVCVARSGAEFMKCLLTLDTLKDTRQVEIRSLTKDLEDLASHYDSSEWFH